MRNRTVIVGEDLGVVPDGFRERWRAERLCSCRLLWFERGATAATARRRSTRATPMVSITTHDLPTLAGFWSGHDLETRREIGLFPAAEASRGRARGAPRRSRRRLLELLVGARAAAAGAPRATRATRASSTASCTTPSSALLCATPSRYFLLAQEDLFKVRDQQNVPGTVTERPNWVWRMPWTIEELGPTPAVRDFARMFRENVGGSGRLRSAGGR